MTTRIGIISFHNQYLAWQFVERHEDGRSYHLQDVLVASCDAFLVRVSSEFHNISLLLTYISVYLALLFDIGLPSYMTRLRLATDYSNINKLSCVVSSTYVYFVFWQHSPDMASCKLHERRFPPRNSPLASSS